MNQYTMRRTDPAKEMAWMVLIDNQEIEWCADRPTADRIAGDALRDAETSKYSISVHVLECRAQNGE